MKRPASVSLMLVFAVWLTAGAAPFSPDLPGNATQTANESSPATDYLLLTGPWSAAGGPSLRLEGARQDRAWRLDDNHSTTLQILSPLRAGIEAAGFTPVFECETDACGGFDFRYALDLPPEPAMHVDLGDFRYFAARRGNEWLAVTVSRSSESGFVGLTTLVGGGTTVPTPPEKTGALTVANTDIPGTADFAAQLESRGSAVLEGLSFASGEAALAPEKSPALDALAAYLTARPETRIVLVGHTDATGDLAANIALSRQRAEAVRERLIRDYGISPGRLAAEGAGWLSPLASSRTAEGRAKNRRVEAVLAPAGD